MKWIKLKLDFLNHDIKFQTIEEFQIFENLLQIIKNEQLINYNQSLHRIKLINNEFKVNKY